MRYEKVEVEPDNDDVARQWEIRDKESGEVIAIKHRWKAGKNPTPYTPRKKTTRQLLEEILAKLP